MKPITVIELRRLKAQIDAAAKLIDGGTGTTPWTCGCHCRTRIEHAHRVADQAAGLLKATANQHAQSGDHADPVFTTAYPALAGLGTGPQTVTIDPSPTWLEQLTETAIVASKAIADLITVVHVVGSIETTDPRTLAATGTGNCLACDHLCTGVNEDRLRSGFCPACRMAYKRAGSPDRFAWSHQRRADLARREDTG